VAAGNDGFHAHVGVLRRYLAIAGRHQLVADLGLMAVRPDLQRTGIGSSLLAGLHKTLIDLGIPFGFLGCRPELIPFYGGNGWCRLPGDVKVRYLDNRDPWKLVTLAEPLFVLPVSAPLSAWPESALIDRNGQEV